ncbi:Imm26 family immunity protein [Pseudoalteromonas sp. Cnat2-41]|uniref:Imm26 family immunity protein n=1 Tax=unclassified Pseudoalteromonas TaxID=194690 RepID=UPI001EF95F59|nr:MULTISPECIES: Imm26 family immunity protein [unclassified Pseudoalteromonas]MCF2861315.1 immunity 26 domain-containing protein [Pseudoalteromonas sp. CNAT2-18]MCG7557646.1 Imm26 family immunity protein [Pseudoalteromonas sp. CNAT2-18.1]MCG7565241.1 Imm26 family immunity protein [Pseudoalteromonas sp. CnMc7-15]
MALPQTNMEVQKPYRKKPKVGDIFRLKYSGCRYIFGQVVSLTANTGGFENCIKVNVFDFVTSDPEKVNEDEFNELMFAPLFINRLGFSRGYMPILANKPLMKLTTKYCYFDVPFKKYIDPDGDEIPNPVGLVGTWGLSNYLVLDDLVSEKLGIPCIDDI